nr:MAG TPA: hypothetical protein [Caudoviricetes sp.]
MAGHYCQKRCFVKNKNSERSRFLLKSYKRSYKIKYSLI